MKKEPTVYKFTFYGCAHPWVATESLPEQVDEALCYIDGLQQMTKLEVTELSLKEKPKPRRKAVKKGETK
jgi:hypothetical protein|tara:strand:+ start:30 stop:239 length:210 start_codon:yes stop_codon:yes gene_type:complete